MKKLILQHFLALSILLLSLAASADTFDNAVKFFDFAEDTYPTLLTPKRPSVQEIQGYYVRYYSDSGIYIGLLGDQVYALGGVSRQQPNLRGGSQGFCPYFYDRY